MRKLFIVLEVAGDFPAVYADEVLPQQITRNLLLNDFDAMTDARADERIIPTALYAQRDGMVRIACRSRDTIPVSEVKTMTDEEPLVLVVDDDDSVRRALARLIRSVGYSVEVFSSASGFLANVRASTRPVVLVLDIELPDVNGLQLQRELGAEWPIIFITGYGDIAMTVQAMKAGACDFLSKPVCESDLLCAIEQAHEHARKTYTIRCEVDTLRRRFDRLTPRERQVMALVVSGRLNKQVASSLGTTEKTIKAHRARVMAKMEVRSLAQLIRIADRAQIFSSAESGPPR